jgi:amidohydrolase
MTAITEAYINLIRSRSSELLSTAIRIRRELHMNPELSFREENTARFIARQLDNAGIQHTTGIAGTGIIATLEGAVSDGPVVVLRAELDALPINEQNDISYRSITSGVMHACGHDAHMAMIICAGILLRELSHLFSGRIVLLFQPGEELLPGGASLVLREGTLRHIKPDAVIAQHVLPELETGFTGFRPGRYMASNDEIYISVKGRGGHAALPGESTDQVAAAAELVYRLKKKIPSDDANNPVVLGIGKFIANGATNVIPEKVLIEGTLRTFDEGIRSKVHKSVRIISDSIASKFNLTVETEIRHGYPVLFNDPELTGMGQRVAAALHGEEKVTLLPLRMSSEDFAWYSQEFPVLFFRTGVRKKDAEIRPLHTSAFNIDEKALENGIATISAIALEALLTLKRG